jgi:hypothetical protein
MKDLEGFYSYLQDTLGPDSSAISTYCSMVRRVQRTVKDLTEANLTDFFYSDLNPTMRANIRAAWSHYVRYMASVENQVIPEPRYVRISRTSKALTFVPGDALPSDVLEAIWTLLNIRKWDAAVLLHATWGSVVERPEHARLGNRALLYKLGRIDYWSCDESELAPLRKWSATTGNPVPGAPLLPRSPDSLTPYPRTTLLQGLKALQLRPELVADHPMQKETAVTLPPAVKSKNTPEDQVGKPCTTQELEALLRAPRVGSSGAVELPPENQNFFFLLDARMPPGRVLPPGIKTPQQIEEERQAAPPRGSAAGGAVHRQLDLDLAAYGAWAQGAQELDENALAAAEPFVFDLEEDQ